MMNSVPRAVFDQPSILGEIERVVDTDAFAQLSDYVMLHAGVIAAGDRGILLPAASGAGKSTLVTALCLSGFRYLSDEFAVICPESLSVQPYAKSVCLKPDGWALIREAFGVSAEPVPVCRADGQLVRFLPAPRQSFGWHGAEVRAVIIPDRQRSGPARLEPITSTDALGVLLQQTLNLPLHGVRGLDALARLVEEAECFRLTYANLNDVVEIVTAMVAEL